MQTLLRSATLTTTHLCFTVRARIPLELDMYSGAALRGGLFYGIWRRFCENKSAPTCAACPLNRTCPVSTLVAPLREENARGQDIPRPYVITPPTGGARRYEPGESFIFHLTLIGNIVQLLPYIMLSIPQLEAEGLGHRLDDNRGQRGQFQVEQVESYHPFTQERQTIYRTGDMQVQVPVISISANECQQQAEQLDRRRMTLHFITPTRLVEQEHPVRTPSFSPLIRRLLERYTALERYYGNEQIAFFSKEERDAIAKHAETVQCVVDETRWHYVSSYSNRQKQSTQIGGLVGKATFEGDLEPFLGLLVIGELIHVGKNVVKGSGWYRIER